MYADVVDSNPKNRMRLQIDENLKRIYGETLSEPVPDRLMALLDELRKKAAATDAVDPSDLP
ncbi:NepR family anti-sigma factor [Tabrizicola sp. BL-A-41-H6]|uniref:NepR family anti-sigma factor n=1 Tax=Tabrizicola sp. BL-A-41-H6 TaxID=3421107 RepID=UPI003D66A815